jgi:hypothetical protein
MHEVHVPGMITSSHVDFYRKIDSAEACMALSSNIERVFVLKKFSLSSYNVRGTLVISASQ